MLPFWQGDGECAATNIVFANDDDVDEEEEEEEKRQAGVLTP